MAERTIGQIWYTRSTVGLDNISTGYRVRAASSGFSDLQGPRYDSIARYFSYQLPQGGNPYLVSPENAPFSFAFAKTRYGNILVHKVYIGRDSVGRPGNYFAHLLAFLSKDFSARAAIELWRSPLWQRHDVSQEVQSTQLSELSTDDLMKQTVRQKFQFADVERDLHDLLTAFLSPVRSQLRVRITGSSTNILMLIWGLTHSIPKTLLPDVTFTTYEHDPDRSNETIVGTITSNEMLHSHLTRTSLTFSRQLPSNADTNVNEYVSYAVKRLIESEDGQSLKLNEIINEAEKSNITTVKAFIELFRQLTVKEKSMPQLIDDRGTALMQDNQSRVSQLRDTFTETENSIPQTRQPLIDLPQPGPDSPPHETDHRVGQAVSFPTQHQAPSQGETLRENPPSLFAQLLANSLRGAKQPGRIAPRFRLNCPFCNREFHPNDCAIYSTLRFDDNRQNIQLRLPPLSRFIARMQPVSSLDGPEYAQDAACRQCPRCKNFLPYRFEIDTNFTIALVGDAFSGKSHYLAALLHQLIDNKIQQPEGIRVHLRPMNNLAKKQWQEYQETLFKRHGPLSRTVPFNPRKEEIAHNFSVREPLIFQLEIVYYSNRELVNSKINVVFYDISGEDITDEGKMSQFGWPVMQAQAIIYFVDTLSIHHILDRLPADDLQVINAKNLIKTKLGPYQLIKHVIDSFTRYYRLSPDDKVSTPIAIMLSKSDVLDDIAQANGFEQARFLKDNMDEDTIDLNDMEIVNHDVQKFLKQFGEVAFLQNSNLCFTTVSFFATSATGCTPDADGTFKEVKPRRCLDPFFWLLWKLTDRVSHQKK